MADGGSQETIITWNLPNLVTVPLMVAVVFAAIVTVIQLWKNSTVGYQGAPVSDTEPTVSA